MPSLYLPPIRSDNYVSGSTTANAIGGAGSYFYAANADASQVNNPSEIFILTHIVLCRQYQTIPSPTITWHHVVLVVVAMEIVACHQATLWGEVSNFFWHLYIYLFSIQVRCGHPFSARPLVKLKYLRSTILTWSVFIHSFMLLNGSFSADIDSVHIQK